MPLIVVPISTHIDASAEVVFDFVTNTANLPLWNSGMSHVSPHTQLTQGMVFHSTNSVMGHEVKTDNLIERLVPNREMIIVNNVPPLTYRAVFGFTEVDGGTTLTCDLEIRGASSIINLAKPVLEYLARTRLEADFFTLKTLVENRTALDRTTPIV